MSANNRARRQVPRHPRIWHRCRTGLPRAARERDRRPPRARRWSDSRIEAKSTAEARMQPLVVQPAKMTVSDAEQPQVEVEARTKESAGVFFRQYFFARQRLDPLVDLDHRRAVLQDRKRRHFLREHAGVMHVFGVGDGGVEHRQLGAPEGVQQLARCVDLPSEIPAQRRRRIGEAVDKVDNYKRRIAPIARSAGEAFALIIRPGVALPVTHARPPDCADPSRMGSPKAVCQRILIRIRALPQHAGCEAVFACAREALAGLRATWDCSPRLISFPSAEAVSWPRRFSSMI